MKFYNTVVLYIENQPNARILSGVLLITLIAFINLLFGHEFLTYDDNWYIYENKNVIELSVASIIESFTSTKGGQYSPVTEVYHALIYSFFEKNATAFKFFALLTHLVNVAMVFKLFSFLSKNRWLVIFVTLVFAIHPLQVETLGWLSVVYRLAVMFMLFGYYFYTKYLENQSKWHYFALTILFYVIALFTKEQAVLFPIGIVLINLSRGHGLFEKRTLKENAILGAIALVFAYATVQVTKTGGPSIIERNVSFIEKIALFAETVSKYIGNFLYPSELSFSYPYPLQFSASASTYGYIILAAIILGLSIFACFKNKQLRFGLLWGFGFLSIAFTFSFFHLRDTFMADRYIYFAIIGFSYALFWLLKLLKKTVFKETLIVPFLGFFYIVMLFTATLNRVPVFKNSGTLWVDAINKNPENHLAYNSLGYYLRINNRLNLALKQYKKALELNPDYYLAHSNLGKVYFEQKNYKNALVHIDKALSLNPNYFNGRKNRIAVNEKLGRSKAMLDDIEYVIKNDTSEEHSKLILARAKIYFKAKDYKRTLEDVKQLISQMPKDAYLHYLGGHSLFMLKKYPEAEQFLSKAISLNSKDASSYYYRGLSRLTLNKKAEASKDILQAKALGQKINPKLENIFKSVFKSYGYK